MASLWMTVCLRPPVVDVRRAISDAMKPFEIGLSDVSLDRWKWDRWRISCGSGDAGFRIVPGFEYHLGLVGSDGGCESGWCAGGPRFALDLDGRREEAAWRAGLAWDTWHELSRLLPPARPLVEGAEPDVGVTGWLDPVVGFAPAHDVVMVALVCHV